MAQTEIKVQFAAYGSILAGALIAVLNTAVADNALLGNLPGVVQFLVVTLVPGVVSWLGGFVKKSRTSTVSTGYSKRPVLD